MASCEQLVPEADRHELIWSEICILIAELNSKDKFHYEAVFFAHEEKEDLLKQSKEYLYAECMSILKAKGPQFVLMVPGVNEKTPIPKLAYALHALIGLSNTKKKSKKRSLKDIIPEVSELLVKSATAAASKKARLETLGTEDFEDCTSLTSSQEEVIQEKITTMGKQREYFKQNKLEVRVKIKVEKITLYVSGRQNQKNCE
jgi:hypothetical protein